MRHVKSEMKILDKISRCGIVVFHIYCYVFRSHLNGFVWNYVPWKQYLICDYFQHQNWTWLMIHVCVWFHSYEYNSSFEKIAFFDSLDQLIACNYTRWFIRIRFWNWTRFEWILRIAASFKIVFGLLPLTIILDLVL